MGVKDGAAAFVAGVGGLDNGGGNAAAAVANSGFPGGAASSAARAASAAAAVTATLAAHLLIAEPEVNIPRTDRSIVSQ